MKKLAHIYSQYTELYRTSSKELWVIYFARIMESLAYFATIMVMVLFFSKDLGMDDMQAGKIFGLWTLVCGLLSFFMGAICDAMGIRLSLVLGLFALLIGRLIFAVLPFYTAIVFIALPLLALGWTLMMPIKSAAIKQYTTKKSRGLAFGLYYALMNIGALVAGLCLDRLTSLTRLFGYNKKQEIIIEKGHDVTKYVINLYGLLDISTYQMVFLFAFFTTLMGFIVVVLFLRKGSFAEEDIECGHRIKKTPFKNLYKTFQNKTFWKFLIFLLLMSLLKLLFTHIHITVPKFMLREIGSGAAIGKVYAINGLMLVLLPPIVSPLLQKYDIYKTIVVGSFISAISPLFLAVNYSIYIPLGNYLSVHHVYIPLILFFVFFSIGESIWSPKLYEYTANIAPKGEETTYVAWSALPWVFSKPLAGILSGYLLIKYCPEVGEKNSGMMWLIISLTTIAAPIILLIMMNFFRSNYKRQINKSLRN